MKSSPRWFTETPQSNSQRYVERFRHLAASGVDLDGEARLIDAMVGRHARILDAGCGSGRTAAALFSRGHVVVGVDIDATLVAAAREDYPGPKWVVADLVDFDLPAHGYAEGFDIVVSAGNVLSYVEVGTEVQVLERLHAHLKPAGRAVIGFQIDRYAIADFDRHVNLAGFVLEQRFATWDLQPWSASAEFAVSILRKP
ncbi:MAG: class I SAM-dependent methyltransferase [Actinomycetota bacterium]|nr:class I SAM-dependent methyltransferase [Actinomycetota bacterium]